MDNMLHPVLSFIIPVYNTPIKYLHECIDSINELDINYEIIIIDDGSCGSVRDEISKISLLNSRVKCIHIDNSGVSTARNYGIDNSSGEYLFFLDADDMVHNDFIKLINGDYKLNRCGYFYSIEEFGTKESKKKNIGINNGGLWGKLFNRSIVVDNQLRFKPNLKIGEDDIFVRSFLKCTDDVDFNPKVCGYRYRISSSSVTHKYYPNIHVYVENYLREMIDMGVNSNEVFRACFSLLYLNIICKDFYHNDNKKPKKEKQKELFSLITSNNHVFFNVLNTPFLNELSFFEKKLYKLIIKGKFEKVVFLVKAKKIINTILGRE